MQRKVNQIGPSTLMVSLPSKWAKRYNVRKGDSVEVTEEGKSLHIYPERNTSEGKKASSKENPEKKSVSASKI